MSALAIRQGTAEWHEHRRAGIGSSDAPIITGDSPWGSRRRLYDEKIGEAEPAPATPMMRLGSMAEALIADLYSEKMGVPLSAEDTVRTHPDLPWMRASVDRWAGERIVECKLAGFAGVDWGDDGTDEVPAHVLIQVQHQLGVTGAPVADVAALIRNDLHVYTIERDDQLIDLLIGEEQDFWNHVERRDPPPVDGSEATRAYLTARHPADNGAEMVADADIAAAVTDIWNLEAEIDRLETERRAAQNRIKDRMGDVSVCRGAGFRVDWKRTKDGLTVNWEGIATPYLRSLPPDEREALVSLHSMTREGVRRFRIYGPKEKGQ